MTTPEPSRSLLVESLLAHALRFGRPLAPAYAGPAGARMLLAFVAVAFVLFFALRLGLEAAGFAGAPVALAYLLFQRRVTEAITLSAGIKG